MDRLKRELTQGGSSDSRGGHCSPTPPPRALSQQPQPVARTPSPSPILRGRSRGTASLNRLPGSPEKETPARRKPSPFKFVDDDDSDFEDTHAKRKKGQKPGKTAAAEKGKPLTQRTSAISKRKKVAPAGSKCDAPHYDGPSTSGAMTSKRSSSRISAAQKRKLDKNQDEEDEEDEGVDEEAAETGKNQPTQPEVVDQPTQHQRPGPMVSALLRMKDAEDFLSQMTRFNHLLAEETAARAVPAIALPPAVAPTIPGTLPNVNDAGPSAKKKRKKNN